MCRMIRFFLPASVMLVLCGPWQVTAGTWTGYNQGLRSLTVNGIGIAPSAPGTIYIQARSLGVFRSTDGGLNWTKTATFNNNNGPGYDHIIHEGPAVHPSAPDIVWAASGGQVYKTTNGGGSWSLSSSGTTINGCNGVHGIVIDPNDPDHLVAGTIVAGCDGGVLESTDGGATWTNIAGSNVPGSGVGNDAWPIALDGSNPDRLYCGSPHNSVYRSTDGGSTWINSPPVNGDHSSYEVVINPLDPSEIWCSEVEGTWVSADFGATWTRQTHLFNDSAIKALRFAPSDGQIAYAIVGSTVWRSGDNGATFQARASIDGGPRCLEIDPANPDVVYVGTAGLGMFKSTDAGGSFSEINNGLPMTQLIRGWQTFNDPLEEGSMYCVLEGNLLYRLDKEETDWQFHGVLPGNNLPRVVIERQRPNRWYFASGGLWRSLDSGQTWQEIYTHGADTLVFDFWLDPRQCGRIVLGDRDGSRVVESLDGGDTWTTLGTVTGYSGSIGGICGDPFDHDVYLIAAAPSYHSDGQNGYIWRSVDGAQTWEHVRDGMFYGDWRIGNGYWKLVNNVMRQEQKCCSGYFVSLDHHTFGNGTFQCRVRIIDTDTDQYWAGFTIRLATPDDHFVDSGWLVYMRRNGVVALHNNVDGTVINAAQTPVVANTSVWNTLKLIASDNSFELYANDTLVGTYTDLNHRYDDPGYFALQTNRTWSEFNNLDIQAETSYFDAFDKSIQFGAYWGRFVAADPHNPGRFAYTTQWGGMWFSTDHGATWYRISADDRNGYLFYRPVFSERRNGNCYVSNGYSYSWRIDNFHNDGTQRQRIGQDLSYSTWLINEDTFSPDRLYAAFYDMGISTYDDSDITGELAPAFPVWVDYDGDGDTDLDDFGVVQACLGPAGVPQTNPACQGVLLDDDDDTDQDDLQLFLGCMTGPNVPSDPACDCFPH